MTPRPTQLALAAVALLAGAGIGAGVYAAAGPGGTTTIVRDVTTDAAAQQIAATTGLTVTEIYNRTYRGVVDLSVRSPSSFTFGRGGSQGDTAEGSGFVYDTKGDIVTNEHVVSGATSITVEFWNGATYKARLVGSDKSTDLAVIRVSAPESLLQPLKLADSATVQVGAGVVAIGSPFGYAQSVTSGIVSALHRVMDAPNDYAIDDAIQTDAPINHGNSGGPLLNAQGQVIGVNAQIQSSAGGSNGVGFAIPSNTVQSIVSRLAAGKRVVHAFLGIYPDTATTAHSARAGAVARRVSVGDPAWKAGIRAGDVIVRIADTEIASSEDLTRAVDSHKPGDTIDITFERNGKTHTVRLTLGTRPST